MFLCLKPERICRKCQQILFRNKTETKTEKKRGDHQDEKSNLGLTFKDVTKIIFSGHNSRFFYNLILNLGFEEIFFFLHYFER